MQKTSVFQSWVYACKPASWPKLLAPAFFGYACGFQTGQSHWLSFLFVSLFVFFDGLYIVLMNDWADINVDVLKRAMFKNECSPKTIVDGLLPSWAVGLVGALGGVGVLLLGGLAAFILDKPILFFLAIFAVVIFASYSLKPVRLNYRGGGELMEAFGVGLLLPYWAFVCHSQELWSSNLQLLLPFFFFNFSSGLASGLSDEDSDRIGGKRTFAVMFGNTWTRRMAEVSMALGWALWALWAMVHDQWLLLPLLLGVYFWIKVCKMSNTAIHQAFAKQREYKTILHRGIWWPTALAGVILGLASI